MTVLEHIKASFYLIVAVGVAIVGLNHCLYGLIVCSQNSNIHTINLSEIENVDFLKNRYLQVNDVNSIVEPLEFVDKSGNGEKYIYALCSTPFNMKIDAVGTKAKIILESKYPIKDWENTQVRGLLKPYWSKIDDEIIFHFAHKGLSISKDAVYLELNSEPWAWYWHVLIISIASLFFYRMIEAIKIKWQDSSKTN